jgi:hypothetical protein
VGECGLKWWPAILPEHEIPSLSDHDLIDAFYEVVANHVPNWSGGSAEPKVSVEQDSYPIATVDRK